MPVIGEIGVDPVAISEVGGQRARRRMIVDETGRFFTRTEEVKEKPKPLGSGRGGVVLLECANEKPNGTASADTLYFGDSSNQPHKLAPGAREWIVVADLNSLYVRAADATKTAFYSFTVFERESQRWDR